jgi:hypothetical protein
VTFAFEYDEDGEVDELERIFADHAAGRPAR